MCSSDIKELIPPVFYANSFDFTILNIAMRIKSLFLAIVISICFLLMSFIVEREKSIEGTWIRKGDNLMVTIEKGKGSIIKEGNVKFPCDVSDLLIYKDIRQVKENHWTCNFLVVTMGSCDTAYEAGELFINNQDELVIICPGFPSKIYSKMKPRYKPTAS
jgi:hypothetical protein